MHRAVNETLVALRAPKNKYLLESDHETKTNLTEFNLEENTMKFNDIEFDTYFKNYPDANGYFGKYGGSYIPPELQTAMNDINEAYQTICKSR